MEKMKKYSSFFSWNFVYLLGNKKSIMKQLMLNVPNTDYKMLMKVLKDFPDVSVTDDVEDYSFTEKQKSAIRAIDKKHKNSEYKSLESVKKSLARKYLIN